LNVLNIDIRQIKGLNGIDLVLISLLRIIWNNNGCPFINYPVESPPGQAE